MSCILSSVFVCHEVLLVSSFSVIQLFHYTIWVRLLSLPSSLRDLSFLLMLRLTVVLLGSGRVVDKC